jgi:hypothetical protein
MPRFVFKGIMKTVVPIELLAIEEDGFHLVINGKLGGEVLRLLVDTGASKTVFDEERLLQLINPVDMKQNDKLSTGLGTNTMESKLVTLPKLEFGELCIRDLMVAVLDLSHVNVSYGEMNIPPLDGVLGGDVLRAYGAEINYKSKTVVFHTTA